MEPEIPEETAEETPEEEYLKESVLQEQIKALTSLLEQTNSQKDKLDNKVSKLKGQLEKAKTKHDDISTQVTTLTTDLEKITDQTAAVMVEIIQGAGGVVLPKEAYLAAMKKRCEEVGALLIVDEIQTGFGRTGTLFAHQWAGIEPDILVLAKALGGGFPLGAL